MRIMFLIGSLKLGGAEKVVSVLARSFDKERCRVYIMAFETGSLEAECCSSGAQVLINPFQWTRAPFWLYHFIREIRRLKIDVLHTHLFTADLLGRIGGRLAGIPVVVSTIHAPSTWKRSGRLKDRLRAFVDRVTANVLADALYSISKEVSEYQVRYGGIRQSKISLVSNPVVTSAFSSRQHGVGKRAELGLSDHHTVLTNVASLKKVKGQKYLIEALGMVVSKLPDVRLLLIGDGPDMEMLRHYAEQLNLSERILFLGNRLDVAELLAVSDIFVMSSLSEGISVAILEAMASGLPIVATAVGGNRDIIKDGATGLLVKSEDATQLANAVERLCRDTAFARLLGEQARRFVVEHHDAGRIALQLEESYRSLYRQKRGGEKARGDK